MTSVASDSSSTGEIPLTRFHGEDQGLQTPTPKTRRKVRWFWAVVGWLALFSVVVALTLRWQTPRHPLIIAVVGLMPFFAVPLGFAGFSAWLSRSRVFRVATATVTAAFVLTVTPADAVIGCRAETAADEITIYSANVLADGGRVNPTIESVLAADPDVVVMQEVRWEFMQQLRADPRLSEYQYWSVDSPGLPNGDLVWSKWPLVDATASPFASEQIVSATVLGPTGEFRVNNVHVRAPAQEDRVWIWQQQHQMLSEMDQSSPTMLAGDFNATSDHKPFRNLLNNGWNDVHDTKGCGFDATWPVGTSLPLSVYRLDHVLVTDHFEVLDVRFGDPAGSDHKPVIATVRLR